MLKRYWLITFPENRYGPKNFGVTAFSIAHAKSLALEELHKLEWKQFSDTEINKAEIIEDIDIRKLDQDHVFPNMGAVSRPGVWFPNCHS